MNLSDISARIQLLAKASPTAFAAGSLEQLGVALRRDYTDANLLYSRRMTAAASGNERDFTLADGSASGGTGSPTIAHPSSGDYETATIALETLYAIVISFADANAGFGQIACSLSALPDVAIAIGGMSYAWFSLPGTGVTGGDSILGDITLTLGAPGDIVDLHVLGKTT